MIRLFHTKIGFYRIYPSGFYVDPGFSGSVSQNILDAPVFLTRKFETFMPSCPHNKHNKLIINHLYINVKILTLIHALMPSLHFQDNFLIAYWLSVIYSLFYKLFQLDTKQSIPKLFPRKKHHKGFVPPRNDGLRCVGKDKKHPRF